MRKLCCVLALCTLFLTGCQLAQGEENSDWLIGFYVSLKPIGEDGERFDGVQETGEDGLPLFVFSGIEGYPLYYYPVPVDDRGFSWYTSGEKDYIPCGRVVNEIAESQEGTVFVAAAGGGYTLYPNPVYVTETGEIYVVAQEGPSGRMDEPGTVLTCYQEGTVTYRLGGKTKRETVSVTCHLESVAPVEKTIIFQMGEENQVLDRLEVRPGEAVEFWLGHENTSYLLTETYYEEGYGEVQRETFAREDPITIPYYLGDGRVMYDPLEIIWENGTT